MLFVLNMILVAEPASGVNADPDGSIRPRLYRCTTQC